MLFEFSTILNAKSDLVFYLHADFKLTRNLQQGNAVIQENNSAEIDWNNYAYDRNTQAPGSYAI